MEGVVFDIKRDCSEDGPGIRTTVFFQGCPLACAWCQNPEGQARQPGIAFRAEACIADRCGTPCVEVCASGALTLGAGRLIVAHERCTRCDRCFGVCPTHALEPVGNTYTVDELLYRVLIDRPFFDATGGGVTVSGGEATMQMPFVGEFLRRLKQAGVDTAIETSGFFNYARFRALLLPWLDRIYYDLKLMDEKDARRWTGQSNRPILDNLARLLREAKIPVHVRVPLVPGITAREDNLRAIAAFLRAHGVGDVTLLPYNPTWTDKPARLGLPLRYDGRKFMTEQELSAAVAVTAAALGKAANE